MQYDCEIEGCVNKTNEFLCEYHSDQALDESNKIIVCDDCNKIVKIEKRKLGENRYEFVTNCMWCQHHRTEKGNPEDPFLPGEAPDQ